MNARKKISKRKTSKDPVRACSCCGWTAGATGRRGTYYFQAGKAYFRILTEG
jgi:hypothetical protein